MTREEGRLGRIHLKGLAIHAFHGVLDEEARLGQRFLIDLDVALDTAAAERGDDPAQTVSYADLAALTAQIATQNRFRLIETLAARIAEAAIEAFPLIHEITVRVEKPSAPIPALFETVAVETTRRRAAGRTAA